MDTVADVERAGRRASRWGWFGAMTMAVAVVLTVAGLLWWKDHRYVGTTREVTITSGHCWNLVRWHDDHGIVWEADGVTFDVFGRPTPAAPQPGLSFIGQMRFDSADSATFRHRDVDVVFTRKPDGVKHGPCIGPVVGR